MQLAMKKYAASGTAALMGAGVMLSVPMVQQADIALPELRAPVVELTAVPAWLTGLTFLGQGVAASLTNLALDEIADPLPIVSQVFANQVANGQTVATGVVTGAAPVAAAIIGLPGTAALIVDTAINTPAALPALLAVVVDQLIQLPAAAIAPILNALNDVVQTSLANAAEVFGIVTEATPALITEMLTAAAAIGVTAVGTGINVVTTALTNPLGVPDAIGNGVLATATVTVGVVAGVVESVGEVRDDIVTAITPAETTARFAPTVVEEIVDPRPAVRALQGAVADVGAEVQRSVRVGTQVLRSGADVTGVTITATGRVANEVVEAGVRVGSAALTGNAANVRAAIAESRTQIGTAVSEGRDDVNEATATARTNIRNAAADPA